MKENSVNYFKRLYRKEILIGRAVYSILFIIVNLVYIVLYVWTALCLPLIIIICGSLSFISRGDFKGLTLTMQQAGIWDILCFRLYRQIFISKTIKVCYKQQLFSIDENKLYAINKRKMRKTKPEELLPSVSKTIGRKLDIWMDCECNG